MSHGGSTTLGELALVEMARLDVSAVITQTDTNAHLDILGFHNEPTGPSVPFDEILKAEGEVDVTTAAAIVARAQIISPLIFTVNDIEIPAWRVLHERTRLERSIDGSVTFSFALARRSQHDREFIESLGSVGDFCGPPPGLQTIDVDQIVFGSGGPRRVRLVTDGVVIAAPASLLSREGEVREYSCTDAAGRFINQSIELTLPPGHGLTREEVVGRICDELGITNRSITIPDDGPTYKELQIVDGKGWSVLQRYLAAINSVPAFDRDGVFVVRSVDKPLDNDSWTWTPQLLIAPVTDNPSSEGPTTVEVRSNAQVVHDGTGLRSEITTIEIFQIFSILAAKSEISSTVGTTDDTGNLDGAEVLQLFKRIITTKTFEIDTLIFEKVETYGYRFTETRVKTQVGQVNETTYTFIVGTLLVSTNGPAVTDSHQRWRKTDIVATTYNYGTDGFLESIEREVWGWYRQRSRAAVLDGNGAWDYVDAASTYFNDDVVAGGSSSSQFESLMVIARETTDFVVDDGFITQENTSKSRFFARPGSQSLFNGGLVSRDSREEIRTDSSRITTYTAEGEQNAVALIVDYDFNGATTDVRREELESYLPAAKKKTALLPDPLLFPNGKVASRAEHQELEFQVSAEKLEENRPNWTLRISDQYAESLEEVEARARFEIARRSAVPYRWEVPANPLLEVGSQIELDLRPFEQSSLHVQRASLEARAVGGKLAFVTVVEGLLYVV